MVEACVLHPPRGDTKFSCFLQIIAGTVDKFELLLPKKDDLLNCEKLLDLK